MLCASLPAPLLPAQNVTATLEALTPITASWVGAPPGTPDATVTHPAGPLTSVDLATANNVAQFSCDLSNDGVEWTFDAYNSVFSTGPGDPAYAEADLLLTLSAPPGTCASLSLAFQHAGDSPVLDGFQVDVGDDGSFEYDSGYEPQQLSRRQHVLTFGGGSVPVRITSYNAFAFPPQAVSLVARVREWSPHATPAADGCAAIAPLWTVTLALDTDYTLDMVAPTSPASLGTLRARGVGNFNWFCASDSPALLPVQLPAPILGACPLFANVVLTDPGAVTELFTFFPTPVPIGWQLDVPALPPGFTFYMQHACASLLPGSVLNSRFGTSNVIRIDT